MLANQNYSKTESVIMTSSTAKCCNKMQNAFQYTRLQVSSVIKFGTNSRTVVNGKTKIILLSTLIPAAVLLILSIGICGLRSPRCRRSGTNIAPGVLNDLNMEQMSSTTTLDTGSSIELYSIRTTEM